MKRILMIAFLAMHRAGLTAPEVPIIRDLLDTQFRLLLHLERAKLRGQRGKEVTR